MNMLNLLPMELRSMIDDMLVFNTISEMGIVSATLHPLYQNPDFRNAVSSYQRNQYNQILECGIDSEDIAYQLLSIKCRDDLAKMVNSGIPVNGVFTIDNLVFLCPLSVACFIDDECVEFLLSMGASLSEFSLIDAVEETPTPFYAQERLSAVDRARRFLDRYHVPEFPDAPPLMFLYKNDTEL